MKISYTQFGHNSMYFVCLAITNIYIYRIEHAGYVNVKETAFLQFLNENRLEKSFKFYEGN